jgi:hypothetical protein
MYSKTVLGESMLVVHVVHGGYCDWCGVVPPPPSKKEDHVQAGTTPNLAMGKSLIKMMN